MPIHNLVLTRIVSPDGDGDGIQVPVGYGSAAPAILGGLLWDGSANELNKMVLSPMISPIEMGNPTLEELQFGCVAPLLPKALRQCFST